ncbi:odorant-binding protein 2a-like protein [Cricetulus griseus]|nr:odorant-binding protein 2a-like protein [Cricetulus griseus]
MNLTKPIGCIPFKLALYEGEDLGTLLTWWRHVIHIHFLPGKNFAIAYFRGKMNHQYYQIMMLMGRTLEADPDAVRIFKEFVESKIPKTGEIITPPHVGWRHVIHIHFLPRKNFAIAYFRGKMNHQYYQIMMLMALTSSITVTESLVHFDPSSTFIASCTPDPVSLRYGPAGIQLGPIWDIGTFEHLDI